MADDDRRQDPWGGMDFQQLAQRYWGAWGEAMRSAPAGGGRSDAQAGMQAWHDAIDWWTRQAHGNRSGVDDVLERFNGQARGWFGQMQQVAARFAGRDHSARDIADAWKQALGASGEHPFPDMLRSMRGHGLQGLDQWIENASPYLKAWRSESASWLGMPAFGFAREHQERLQALARAQLEYQDANSAYNALMLKASQSALEIFEDKLAEREEPGRQIDSPRALFDLWIDAAEEAYARIALSREFRQVYAGLVNAQMRLRAGIQREVEQVCALLDMPTRSELDGAHRKIVELERSVRRLRDRDAGSKPAAAGAEKKTATRRVARKAAAAEEPASARAAVKKKPAKKTATKRAATKRAAKAASAKAAPAAKGRTGKAGRKPAAKRTRTVREAVAPAVRRASARAIAATGVPLAPGAVSDAAGGVTPDTKAKGRR